MLGEASFTLYINSDLIIILSSDLPYNLFVWVFFLG